MKALVQLPDKQLQSCADANKRYKEHWQKVYSGVSKTTRDSQRLCHMKLVEKWLALQKSLTAGINQGSFITDRSREANDTFTSSSSLQHNPTENQLNVPMDPRLWTPCDVRTWLHHMTETHSIQADSSFFQMNGRGLCLMSLNGFLFRVPVQGKLLYEDFRERLKTCLLAPGKEAIKPTIQKLSSEDVVSS